MIINYNWWMDNISPHYLWELRLSLRKNDKLQVTSESQFSKYSTTTYSSPVSLQKVTSWIFLQILYIMGYLKHGKPMVIVTIEPG